MNIEEEKKKIRRAMKAEIDALTEKDRLAKSRQVATKLLKTDNFKQAKTILFYYATDKEVATKDVILQALAQGKRVLLPRVDKKTDMIKAAEVRDLEKDLVKGSYDIMEPKDLNSEAALEEIDLVIVPGLAFDQAKYRLGHGKGYYDRFLAKLPREVITIGLAFDFQVVEALPVTELDIPVSRIIHS